MRVLLSDCQGRRQEGLLLAASRYRLRVVLQGGNDVIEIRREFDHWITESGMQVEIECLIADYSLEVKRFCVEILPRTLSATSGPTHD